MKLRNKKTGEIGKPAFIGVDYEITILPEDKNKKARYYTSLAELNAEWEDYEEPKEYYYLDNCGDILQDVDDDSSVDRIRKEIGNHFETKIEAEQAIERLKAWKRLKDKGFRFCRHWAYNYDYPKVENQAHFEFVAICEDGILFDDLDLLFGGEE